MDRKRAMLYPQVDFNTPTAPTRDIEHGSPEVPLEAPPSYDVAISEPAMPRNPSQPPPVLVVTGQPLPTRTATTTAQQQQHLQEPTFVHSAPLHLGPNPCSVICPACGAQKVSRMTHTPNTRTHLGAGLLCLVGWCCCACCVPYCMNSCRTGNHYCSKCNTFLGSYSPRGVK
ncbi:lipopolysaccharide-induced tumor necrosis factor-alpha factor homolog [Scaptodrosophila lebanonensis]|uniref:Lipopolysaccharide-induced tumor necrosis factor-alpha factor homolog n=1 Tax=Drosophila lebanonensis TaxID=7225 RepID=A0A6J2UIK2_DROLE|nr:lipopolysaccharide-induced tumor necrosis factor-alpha factor homolog [Scaptodrosophila lebanonensis]